MPYLVPYLTIIYRFALKINYSNRKPAVQHALKLQPPTLKPTLKRLLEVLLRSDTTFPCIPTTIGNYYQRSRLVEKQENPQKLEPLSISQSPQTWNHYSYHASTGNLMQKCRT